MKLRAVEFTALEEEQYNYRPMAVVLDHIVAIEINHPTARQHSVAAITLSDNTRLPVKDSVDEIFKKTATLIMTRVENFDDKRETYLVDSKIASVSPRGDNGISILLSSGKRVKASANYDEFVEMWTTIAKASSAKSLKKLSAKWHSGRREHCHRI